MKNSTLRLCAMLLAICTSAIHLQAMDEWDGKTVAKGFYSGAGTKDNPYRIFTASQFLYFIQQTKEGNTFNGQYIELCNDIAFKTNEGLVEGGDFYGDFDGNDHTIQVNKYKQEYLDYYWGGWHLFNLYGSMHDVLFIRANTAMSIYTGGILYNCRFEFPSNYPAGYHGDWTILLKGGTIANCVSNSASWKNRLEQGQAGGFVSDERNQSSGYCLNCYFPITSYPYSGSAKPNYYGVIESCGEEAGNDWVLNHTEHAYKSWPLTFSPTYPEYQIKEQPQTYNPSVVYLNSDEAIYQWCYQKRKPITLEDITFSGSTQTMTVVVTDDNVILSFDFEADGYIYTGYNDGTDKEAWISVNGEKIVSTYDDKMGTYSCQLSAGICEVSCVRSDITNIRLTYPTETLANETSSVLSKQTIMEKLGVYFCQVSYGEGCDVMNSDYIDYEKLLTIDDVTYVINEDSTATVLWVSDMAVNITIPETVSYDDVDYPVTSISSKAFVDCTSLASINCKSSDVPALLGGITFEESTSGFTPSDVTLYVPVGSESAYSAAEGWKDFGKILSITKEYTLKVSSAGYATLYLSYAAEIPKDVKVYIATSVEEDRLKLSQVTGVLPANTGVIVRAKEGTYTFAKSDDTPAYVEGNLLSGTPIDTYITAESGYRYYVLAKKNDFVAMYHPQLNADEQFLNKANKAYLGLKSSDLGIFDDETNTEDEGGQLSNRLRFDFGGSTGIYNSEIRNHNSEIIFVDLSGRRVESPTKGIYIVNGRKVVIK